METEAAVQLRNPFNAPVYYREVLASTMDEARTIAAKGAVHGTVVMAGEQSSGRGRAGRIWLMNRGESLPFTVLLRYPKIPQALTLRAGLAVARAIEDYIPALTGTVLVKWPNDIMIGNQERARKAAGILTEAEKENVYIGIGINAAQSEFPAFLKDKATSLFIESGKKIAGEERFGLLKTILVRLYAELENGGWRKGLEERLYKKDRPVVFFPGQADSDISIEGRLAGIGQEGELMIIPTGTTEARAFFTGELKVY